MRRVSRSNHTIILLPRNILFHNTTRRAVHGCLVRGLGILSTIVNLPTGLFFNANVPIYILILGHRHGNGDSGVLFVSTSESFRTNGGRGILQRSSVSEVISACRTHISMSGCTRITAVTRVTRGKFGLGVPHCISAFRTRPRVSLTRITNRVHGLRTRVESMSTRLGPFFSRLNLSFPFSIRNGWL